jgi:predicted Zn-dependent protease with MMP-like domain
MADDTPVDQNRQSEISTFSRHLRHAGPIPDSFDGSILYRRSFLDAWRGKETAAHKLE